MKRFKYASLLLIAFVFFQLTICAQTIMSESKSKEVMNLTKGNVYLVLTGDEEFDKSIENSVKTYWKQTSYKTMNAKDVEKNLGDENNYFISLVYFDSEYYRLRLFENAKKASSEKRAKKIVLFNGSKSKLDKYTSEAMIAMIPMILKLTTETNNQTDYLIKSLNDGVGILLNNVVEGKTVAVVNAVFKEIRKDAAILKQKTLLISETEKFSAEILSKYKYKYKVLTDTEIYKLMTEGSKEYCVLYISWDPFRQFFIQDLESKKMVCAMSVLLNTPISEKDFIKLNDLIDGKDNKK